MTRQLSGPYSDNPVGKAVKAHPFPKSQETRRSKIHPIDYDQHPNTAWADILHEMEGLPRARGKRHIVKNSRQYECQIIFSRVVRYLCLGVQMTRKIVDSFLQIQDDTRQF